MILTGDSLSILPTLDAESVQCCVTSPPYYGLRDYGCAGQIGLEPTPEAYVEKLVQVFREVRRVLRDDGCVFLNLGDSYATQAGKGDNIPQTKWRANTYPEGAPHRSKLTGGRGTYLNQNRNGTPCPGGLKPKDLIGIPWRVAFALQADGWYLRQDIIWAKPNPMPESVTDRCTKAHEYIFLLTKSARYYYDNEAVKEDQCQYEQERRLREGRQGLDSIYAISSEGKTGQQPQGGSGAIKNVKRRQELAITGTRNRRSVWTITTKPFKEAHFATFPPEIPEICIKAGTSERGCCPECGSPWVRVGTKETIWRERPNQYTAYRDINGQPDQRKSGTTFNTTGWRPTCTHNLGPIPCTVLDPFSGSGTTGNVAERLGRKYIGIELNPAYAEMGTRRIDAARLPLLEAL
jgi:DNA modification methylase